jgi:hypothetical protein
MYIYNVTVNVEKQVLDEWLEWMKTEHIPEVLATGMFTGCLLNKVLVDEEQGVTYALQYTANDMQSLKLYQEMYAPSLKLKTQNKFGDKCLSFRTILHVEERFSSEK